MTHPYARITLISGAIAAVAVLGFASPASAHDVLVSSTPSADSSISELPDAFAITMNEDLLDLTGDATGFALQVHGASGAFYGDGCLAVAGPVLSMGASLGEPGLYTFVWQAVSSDGHPVSGEFTFTWTGDATAEGSAAPPVCGVTGVEPTATATPSATAEPSAEPTAQPVPDEPANPTGWIIGGVIVLAAVVVLIGVISRRKK